MTHADDRELHDLRRRAYGSDSDIHRDPQALARLRELEADTPSVAYRPTPVTHVPEVVAALPDPAVPDEEPDPAADDESRADRRPVLLPALLFVIGWLSRRRRSTVLIALGSTILVAGILASLILVQRVQSDPLQVGAQQVARLQLDSGYEVPAFFGDSPDASTRAFQEFHGLRTVLGGGFFQGGSSCLLLYSEDTVADPDSQNYEGAIWSGCAAGNFPAIVQFELAGDQVPDAVKQAFPDSNGVQFVYDSDDQEIVVFVD